MPEPERDIEKTLRAYAKKRREEAGAPAELHPATRKLLQGEVARLRGKAQAKPGFWAKVLGASWPQIAFRVSIFVLLASVAVLLLPILSKHKLQLAELSPPQEQAKALNKERGLDGALRYKSPAEEPANRRIIGGTLEDQPALKQDRPPDAPAFNGNVPASKNAIVVGGEVQHATTPSKSVIGLEKDKLSASSAISAEKTIPEPAQAASGNFTLDGLATNAAANRPVGSADVKRENSNYAAAPPVASSAPAAGVPVRQQPVTSVLADSLAIQPATPPPPAAVVSSGSLAAVDRGSPALSLDASKAVANSVTQRFNRLDQPANLQKALKKANQVVLRSFRVVQTGDQIQMFDKDGSIYSGFVGQPDEGAAQSRMRAETIITRGGAERKIQTEPQDSVGVGGGGGGGALQPAQNSFFRVTGTNRSLKQFVVFTGNFIPDLQVPPSAKSPVSNGFAGNKSSAPTAGPMPWQLFNARLQGRATIGGTNQIEIIALPAKP